MISKLLHHHTSLLNAIIKKKVGSAADSKTISLHAAVVVKLEIYSLMLKYKSYMWSGSQSTNLVKRVKIKNFELPIPFS